MRSHSLAVPAFALAAPVFLALSACSDGSSSEAAEPTVVSTLVDSSTPVLVPGTSSSDAPGEEPTTVDIPEPVVEEDASQMPVLGSGIFGEYMRLTGYGTARPNKIALTGICDQTRVDDIVWDSWGGEEARGTGKLCVHPFDPDGGPVPERDVLIARNLGDYRGVLTYCELQMGEEVVDLC